MANVWVQTITGELIRAERVNALSTERVERRGWVVVAHLGRGGPVLLAALGRGGKAKDGARRLCGELPQAIGAARQVKGGATVTFVTAGHPRGEGQWSTLAAPATPVKPIPVVPPDEIRERRRRTGQG